MNQRREFIKNVFASTLIISFGKLLMSCGDDSGTGGVVSGGSCLANGTTAAIGTNHGHTITVTAADVSAGVSKTFNIQGSGDHNHTVTITAAQFASLQGNVGVQITSSTNGHSHTVTVNCA